ncbi:MAG TPA: DinB family protein [Anaerolineales bacterium]
MPELILSKAVEYFASKTQGLADLDLERPWKWGDYEEGVRFAFFRTYEELRDLAARLGAERAGSGHPLSVAQRILSQYNAAYRDLQAVLLGVSDQDGAQTPAEGEWSLREAVIHIIETERSFFSVLYYTLESDRLDDDRPLKIPDAAWDAIWAGDTFERVQEKAPLSELLAYYAALHSRVIDEFLGITLEQISLPSMFWEKTPMPVEFRLHRFDSHLRQHTIQAEKTLGILGLSPSEAHRLLRLIYTALAEVEGVLMGSGELGIEKRQALAEAIRSRAQEITG